MSRFVTFGELRLPGPSGGVSIKVHYKASGKVDQKEHDGADDGTSTWKGRKPRDIEIELTWLYDARAGTGGAGGDSLGSGGDTIGADVEGGIVHQEVCDVLDKLTPASPDAGKPFDFSESDARAQKIANVKSILVKELDLSPPDYDKGTRTAKISADSWVKPKPKAPDATKTPRDPSGWRLGHPPGGTTTGFGGNNNTIGGIPPPASPAKPAVKP
jgi:hypothetical protein